MRRMLLGACALALCGSVVVVAVAADEPVAGQRAAPAPQRTPQAPVDGPFARAAARAQSEASAERHRAARAAYAAHENGSYRPSTAQRSTRVHVIARVAERLDVDLRTMWEAVVDVRRQIAPRTWSDARDESLRLLARELDRPFADVERAVRLELRRHLSPAKGYGEGYRGGR